MNPLIHIKNFSINRPLWSYSLIQNLYCNFIRGKQFQLRKIFLLDKKYLNAGCGANLLKNFINLDLYWRRGLDLCWDITKGIPLRDKSLSGILVEHCLEHLTYAEVFKVLRDFLRILKPGGTLRVIVPDAELYLELYQRNKMGETANFPFWEPFSKITPWKLTPMMEVSRALSYEGNHRSAYDFNTIEMMLKHTGFIDIKKESFGQGRDSILLVEQEWKAPHSLCIEASSPSK